ncbi:hypothetical protein [Tautonia rosea]|nr:hypothetical protein [Tautonia rosea]
MPVPDPIDRKGWLDEVIPFNQSGDDGGRDSKARSGRATRPG